MKSFYAFVSKLFASGLAALLLVLPAAWAASGDLAALARQEGEFVPEAAPLFYSIEKGQWLTGRSGQLFTTGDYGPTFQLPALKGEPTPIRYPKWASVKDLQGLFVVAVEIRADGTVGRHKIMHSTGHGSLDDAAVAAIQTWRFEPAREGGRAVVSCIQVPVRFVLND